jgi:hypothetical protein
VSAPVLTRTVAETATCPPWCDGTCETWVDEVEGSRYHGSPFASIMVDSHDRPKVELAVSVTRLDVPGEPSAAEVHLLAGGMLGEDFCLTPARARELAAMLLNSADQADPPAPHAPCEVAR